MATTSDYLTSLQNDKSRIIEALGLEDNLTFTDIAQKAEDGEIGGSNGIYKVATIEERNAIEAKENDICLVYESLIANLTASDTPQQITFPATVTLPEKFEDWANVRFRKVEGSEGWIDFDVELNENEFRAKIWGNEMYRISYSSEDGINYTRTDEYDETIDLGMQVYCEDEESWNDNFGYFMQVGTINFGGLFTYDGNNWNYTNIKLKNIANKLLPSNQAYTNDGVVSGTLGTTISSAKDIYDINSILSNLSVNSLPENCSYFFANYDGDKFLIDKLLNTSNVTNMQAMFESCINLTELDLSNWDTSKVTNMSNIFIGCRQLKKLNVSNWDTSSVTNLRYAFNQCGLLEELDLSNWDTSKVEDFQGTFAETNLSKYPDLDYSSAKFLNATFQKCENLVETPILKGIESLYAPGIFSMCTSLNKINTLPDLEYCIQMFQGCKSLKEVGDFKTVDTPIISDTINIYGMFSGCTSLETVGNLNFKTSIGASSLFNNCSSLKTIGSIDLSSNTSFSNMFYGCTSLETAPEMSNENVVTADSMFYGCTNLRNVPEYNFTFGTTRAHKYMFTNCPNLTDDSLNNILLLCSKTIKKPGTGNGNLAYMGFTATEYPRTRIEALSNYQAFIDAGWIIGY